MQVQQISFLGGVVRDVTAQFGLNSNATVFTITVVKEGGGHLSVSPRQPVNFSLGALNIHGYVQSWDEQKVNIAGTGVYSVRVTDSRPALECVQVLLQAPTNGQAGKNVVTIHPQLVDDLEMGILYKDVVRSIEASRFSYGSDSFGVAINLPVQSRSIENEDIPYRIRGTAMSLVEFLNQVADDNGFEWYAEGTDPVNIHAIVRTSSAVNMAGLAAEHAGEVIRLTTGTEARDEVARTVLYGAPKQSLIYSPGNVWQPYFGLNRDGTDVNDQLTVEYAATTLKVSMTDIDKILNSEKVDSIPAEMLSRVEDTVNKYVGRQFYKVVAAGSTDENHESWLDACSAGWWNGDDFPDDLPENAKVSFGTDDGRWVSFAKLTPSSADNGTYTDDVQRNPDLFVPAQGRGYTRISIERVDLSDADGNRTKTIWVVVLPFTLAAQKLQATVENGKTVQKQRSVRLLSLDKLWVTMLDHRQAYGPWTSDQLNSKGNKARVVFDNSIAPWTYGYRGMTDREAVKRMTQVAGARLKTCTSRLESIDTGELEVAGLPRRNLGAEIGTGTNVTNVNVNYDVRGIRTLYKCNVYTNELGRYQRYYQELLDKLRRDAERQVRQQDHEALRRELQALKKDIGPKPDTNKSPSDSELSLVARVDQRVEPTFVEEAVAPDNLRPPRYFCTIMREILEDGGFVTYEIAQIGTVPVVNLSEKAGSPPRLRVGSLVRIRPAVREQVKDLKNNNVTAIVAWVMEEDAPAPGTCQGRITQSLNPPGTSGPPLYAVEVISGDTSPLSDDEVALLDEVLNIGEPYTSAGFAPIGTQVEVAWTIQSDLTYKPTFNHALNIFVTPTVP